MKITAQLAMDKPAEGFYKRNDSDKPFRHPLKRKNIHNEKSFNERVKGKQLLKDADSRINNKKSEIPLDKLNQPEAYQANKKLDEIAIQTVQHLACISQFNYDRIRKEEARRLNIRMCTLDDAVKKARKLYASAKSTSAEPEQPDLDY